MIICIHPHHSALQKSLLNAYSSTITVQIIVNHVINNNYLCKSLKVPNFKFADEDLETKICSKIWKRSLFGHNFNRYRQDTVSWYYKVCCTVVESKMQIVGCCLDKEIYLSWYQLVQRNLSRSSQVEKYFRSHVTVSLLQVYIFSCFGPFFCFKFSSND